MKRAGLSKRTPHDESDDAFRLLFFHHPEPMWVYDLGTRAFLEVNDAAMRKYGWRRDEFLAMSIEDLRPAKDALLPAPSAAPDGAGMARHRLKDGRLIDVRIASHALTFRGRRAELVMAQDVTETLRLHAALAQREAELHATLYSIGDAVISTDAVGRIALMNPVAERLTGWTETEARGRPLEEVFRIVNEEMRATAENPVARVLREGLVVGLANHTVLIARDGSERPIADAGAPVRDAAGAVAGVVLVFRDQSAERAAQRKIDDARRFAEGILATLREPLVVLDAALRVVQANRAFYRSFRTAPEHTEGRPLYELGNRQWDIPRLRELLEAVLPHNSHFDDFEIEHDFPQLGRRTMLLNARRLYRDGEKTDFILLAITDVTERKRAERELRESLAWFERLAETAAIAIVVYQDERFVFVNRAAEQISGYTRDELLGMRFWDVVHPEDQALVRERGLARQRGAALPPRYEFRIRRKDGTVRWVDFSATAIEWRGAPAALGSAWDVTERKRAEAEARELAVRLDHYIEASPVVLYLLEADDGGHAPRWVSANIQRITGYTPEEALARGWWESHLHSDDRARMLANQPKLREQGSLRCEYRFLRKDGSIVWIADELRRLTGSDDRTAQFIGTWTDITEQHRAVEQLQFAATVFDNSVEGIFITDAAQRILLANRALATLTGFSREELIGQNPRVFNSGRHDAAFFNSMYAQLAATGRWQGEIWNRRKSGEAFPSWMTITAVRGADGALTHYVGVLLDVSERKVQAERIERLAFYDSLTELPNRALFFDRLEQAIAAARRHRQPLALFFLDLDRFKEVNDTHGHAAGDALLVEVARRLQTTLRHEETLARFGGDEFFAFSPGADQAGAMLIAERIVQAFARPFTVHNAEVYCNASLGVALYPGDGASAEALLKAADIALYRAKEAGGYQFYAHEMGVAVARRTELATRLRRALEARQLQLYYQPQIALKSGALAGAEALARWHDAESGWVSASEFIAIAEERGLIGDLGEWALTEACRQLRAWREAGHAPPGRIAVNVSGRQFREKGFARKMRALVREAALSPAQIELEITETSLLENVEEAARTINALRAAGFTFAIDDFGTGYSSLRYLRQFRAETLKIDMSFVHGVTKNANDRAIIAAVIAMAREVGMKTLAEGVENAAQADALAAMDCDLAQGYYFGHPEPAPAFAARWLRA